LIGRGGAGLRPRAASARAPAPAAAVFFR
jgi:hypothetical protein